MTYVLSRATASSAGADPGPCWQVRHIRYIHIWDTWVAPKRHCRYICRHITSSGVRSSVLGQARKRAQKQKRKRGRHAPHLGCDDRPRKDHGTARCPWPGPLSLTIKKKYTMSGACLVRIGPWRCSAWEQSAKTKKRWHAPGRKPLGITRTQLPAPTKCSSGTGHCCSTYIVCAHAHT